MINSASYSHKRPTSVLFVCGMNAIRSPMAEALTRQMFPDIYVASAGLMRGENDPFAAAVIAEEGLPGDVHNPRELDDLADGFFDLVVALTPQAHDALSKDMGTYSVDVEYWPTPDPAGTSGSREQILDAYRTVLKTLKQRIAERFHQS